MGMYAWASLLQKVCAVRRQLCFPSLLPLHIGSGATAQVFRLAQHCLLLYLSILSSLRALGKLCRIVSHGEESMHMWSGLRAAHIAYTYTH